MSKYIPTAVLLPLAVLLLAFPALAHHGSAAYDTTQVVTLVGTVTDFQFIQPHPLISLTVKDANGNIQNWSVEMTAPNHLAHFGWNGHTLHPGEEIKVEGYAAKNGRKDMTVHHLFGPDGKEIPL
ncbi:MAG TPA: DUF6152 family protein [Candidatus Acidoferrales bacterium]|nr:DUF6152 family protein [Candidatus Acidoferrales bacterium]